MNQCVSLEQITPTVLRIKMSNGETHEVKATLNQFFK